jgi:hypothetical protein
MPTLTPVIRTAIPADIRVMLPLINAAFAIETFLEGTRTDEVALNSMMQKGMFLLANDPSGNLLASVYVEVRVLAHLLACSLWILGNKERGWRECWSKPPKGIAESAVAK